MKFIVLSSLLMFSFSSFSKHHKNKEEMKAKWESMSFEEAKKMKTEKLTERKANIDTQLACVGAATDKAGLKACRKDKPNHKKQ